jgi:hypothetical protein
MTRTALFLLAPVALTALPWSEARACDTSATVVLNELAPAVPGTDADAEWVELYNPGSSAADVEGWIIERATTPGSWAASFTIPAGTTIPAGGFLYVGGTAAVGPAAGPGVVRVTQAAEMGNASSSSDAVRLVTCGTPAVIKDIVVYGSSNASGQVFTDEAGVDVLDARLAPKPSDSQTIQRQPDGADTNDGSADFVRASPTAGATNGGGGGPGPTPTDCAPDGVVVINEFVPDPAGTDTDAEWVELKNTGTTAVDLEGWLIEAGTSPTTFGAVFTFPAGTTLAPGARLVVGGPLSVAASGGLVLDPSGSLGNASSSSDALRLKSCDGAILDVVAYGSSNAVDQVFSDEDGQPIGDAKLAPKPTSGAAAARRPDGADTDDGSADFVVQAPTPGADNADADIVPTCDYELAPGSVLINEVFANPGSDTNPEGSADGGYEWVELFNASSSAVNLGGFAIQQAGAPDDWDSRVRVTFPSSLVLQPGEHLLVHEDLFPPPAGAEVVFALEAGARFSLGNGADGVRLVDPSGCPIDTVIYGGENPDGFRLDSGDVAPDSAVAPAVKEDASLARKQSGVDTDDSAADFVIEEEPTPGEPNRNLACRGFATSGVKLNELLPNPAGTDSEADSEFVELHNPGTKSVNIGLWSIYSRGSRDGSASLEYTIPPGTILSAGGFLVVGGVRAVEADLFTEPFDLPSGTGGDRVWVEDCEGGVADGVVYGGENDDGVPEDDGEVPEETAERPADDQCIARIADGADSDRSAEDFDVSSRCTPGATNARDGGGGTVDPPASGGCQSGADGAPTGCGGNPQEVNDRELGGCATGSGSAWAGLIALVLLRRRRR